MLSYSNNTDFFFQHAVDPGTFELALVLQLINTNTQLVTTHSNKHSVTTGVCCAQFMEDFGHYVEGPRD